MYECMYVCMNVCMHAYMHAYMHACKRDYYYYLNEGNLFVSNALKCRNKEISSVLRCFERYSVYKIAVVGCFSKLFILLSGSKE